MRIALAAYSFGQSIGYRLNWGAVQPLASPRVIDLVDIKQSDVDDQLRINIHVFDTSSLGRVASK